jgi:hypothetical protein
MVYSGPRELAPKHEIQQQKQLTKPQLKKRLKNSRIKQEKKRKKQKKTENMGHSIFIHSSTQGQKQAAIIMTI